MGTLVGVPVGVLVGSRVPTCQDYMPPPNPAQGSWDSWSYMGFFKIHHLGTLAYMPVHNYTWSGF
jgi:hypothetical protein